MNSEIKADFDEDKWTKITLQHPAACVANAKDSFSLVWDSGASMCISNDKADFEGNTKPIQQAKVDGVNSHLKLEGHGTVHWSVLDVNGNLRTLKSPACHAPKAQQRLPSTSTFCKVCPDNEIKIAPECWTAKKDPDKDDESDTEVLISPVNNLPMSMCMRSNSVKRLAVDFAEHAFATRRSNHNLSEPEKELLR